MKPKLYYAHSMRIYNTQQETTEIQQIKAAYKDSTPFDLVNPNGQVRNKAPGEGEMDRFLEVVRQSRLVIVSEYRECVGRGVFAEVCQAFANGISVKVLRDGQILPLRGICIDNPDDWVCYAKLLI